jgi:hypothetical protein
MMALFVWRRSDLKYLRSLLPLALCAAFGVAHAQVTFSNINATYSMNPSSGTINWLVFPQGPTGMIDFTQNAPAFRVGSSTLFTDGASRITYDVTSATALNGFDILIQGDVENFGLVNYSIIASTGSGNIGTVSDAVLGASYTGGVNGAFTKTYHLTFTQAVTSFSITHLSNIDINGQSVPSTSLALIGTIEHNFTSVPEPATMIGLALGASAMLRRRRRKLA